MYAYTTSIENRNRLVEFFQRTGGIAVWRSVSLSSPGVTWATPIGANRPDWQAERTPSLAITDPSQVGLVTYKEAKRFPAALRTASSGAVIKLTDACTRKMKKALAAAGEGAAYRFDYERQEVVILAPSDVIPLEV